MFDAVLGNPPYARVQRFSKEEREQVRNTFRTARGSYDMSVLFAELAGLEELKQYPKTYEYVMRFKSDFENREKGSLKGTQDFFKYIYPKNLCDFEQEKLMSMEISTSKTNCIRS